MFSHQYGQLLVAEEERASELEGAQYCRHEQRVLKCEMAAAMEFTDGVYPD